MDTSKLEQLRDSIIFEEDKILFDEGIKACKHDLLRAAYIMFWIAIVESLKSKIYKLAVLGDSRANNIKSNIEDQEANHQSTDRTIFEGAITSDIISSKYSTDLNYFWEKRCFFAHPYQGYPQEEELTLIINKAIEITLAKDIYYTRRGIDEFLKDEMNAIHLVPYLSPDKENYIRRHLKLVKTEHYPALFKNLFYHISNAIKDNNDHKFHYLYSFIEIFVGECNPPINENVYRIKDAIANDITSMWHVASSPILWNALNQEFKDSLFRYIESSPADEIQTYLVCIHRLLKNGIMLNEAEANIYYNQLGKQPLSVVWQLYYHQNVLVNHIYSKWIEDNQWGKQGKFIEFLNKVSDEMEYFTKETNGNFGYFLGICCRNTTYVAQTFLKKQNNSWLNSKEFNIGIAIGFYKKEDLISVPYNWNNWIIEQISKLSEDEQMEIYNRLSGLPCEKRMGSKELRDNILNILEEKKDNLCIELYEMLKEKFTSCFD